MPASLHRVTPVCPASVLEPPHTKSHARSPLLPLWSVPARSKSHKSFVDLQNDVTVNDIALAARENYQSIEHLKRYTTLGMGTDQGKTSNIVGLAVMAQLLDVPIPKVGTTTFRPPYTPVTLGAIPGHDGSHIEPTRYSAIHDWHAEHGARFINAGLWKRPHSYPGFTSVSGESEDDAVNREARNVRTNVGVVDVSTLGKIELQGRDVAELLNRVYINKWDTLAVGRCRYGVMLREDGIVMDDGTTSRLSETHYLMTTTTVNAVKVMQQLEYSAAGRMARARSVRHVGDRAMDCRRAVRPALAQGVDEARRYRCLERSVSVSRGRHVQRSHDERARPGTAFQNELFGRAGVRDSCAGRSWPRDVGGGDRSGRRIRLDAVRHRSDEHSAHRERARRDRRRRRRPRDGR